MNYANDNYIMPVIKTDGSYKRVVGDMWVYHIDSTIFLGEGKVKVVGNEFYMFEKKDSILGHLDGEEIIVRF